MSEKGPIVKVKQGLLRGKIAKDVYGSPYYSFQGIPYAQPPLGNLRFKSPQPADCWTEIRDATKEGSECFSRHMLLQNIVGSEDCLFLNVYTPTLPTKSPKLLPVMVWIHGGGLVCGSGNTDLYSPDYLLKHDVVVVTLNYRLGLLGFINFEDPSIGVPGNAGLKDQVLALKWIKENIAEFGGDPENVTIFGESAGAWSVHYLILSPKASGLFHKAIIQSGSACLQGALSLERPAKSIAKILNCESASDREIFEIVNKMSSQELFNLQSKIPQTYSISDVPIMGPVVETHNSEDALITEHPEELMKSGKYNQVPVVIGYCSREGLLMDMFKDTPAYNSVRAAENNVPHKFTLPKGNETAKAIAQKIRDFYFGGKDSARPDSNEYYLLQGDVHFNNGIFNTVRYFLETSKYPVYFYRVSIETELNFFKKILKSPVSGVCHADELLYLFKSNISPNFTSHSLEGEAVARFTKLWTTFARTGDPNPTEKDPLINVTWPPVNRKKLIYLEIGENLTVGANPDYSREKFWRDIYNM